MENLIDEVSLKDEFEALKEYHNPVRGWNTHGLDVCWWDGWFVYAGPYPLPLKYDGSVGEETDAAKPFDSVRACITALKLYVQTNYDKFRSIEEEM